MPNLLIQQERTTQPEAAVRVNPRWLRYKPTLVWTATSYLLNAANGFKATLEETGINGKILAVPTAHGRALQGGAAGAQSFRWSQDTIGNGDVTVVLHAAPVAASDAQYALFQSGSVGSIWLGANTDQNGANVSGQLALGLLQTGVNRSSIKIAGAIDGTLSGFVIRKQGTSGAAWKNGQVQTVTTSGTLTGAPAASGDVTEILGSVGNGSFSFEAPLLALYVFQSALPDALCAELSIIPNGWQLFEPEPIQVYWASAGGTTDTAIDADGAATGTAAGASTISSALSAAGEATGTLEGTTGATITETTLTAAGEATATGVGTAVLSSDLDATGAATANATGAAIVSSDLSAAGEATGTLEATTIGVSAADLSAAGEATATGATATIIGANLSAAGEATGTLEATDIGSYATADLDADGAATATAAGASLIDAAIDAAGATTATAATASIASAALDADGEAAGTLEGSEVSGYVTADLAASGASSATMSTATIVAADLSAAGAARAIADTGAEAANAYLTWGSHARRMRIEVDLDDEELVQILPTILPMIMKGQRHGKSYARPSLRARR